MRQIRKQKTPPERGFYQGLRLVAAEHTVLRQRKKYTRSKTNAQFRHGFWRFWVWVAFRFLSKKYCSCIQYLSILRVFAVSEGAAVLPAQWSPGWNGWCRQCLNPWSEHTVLRQSRCWQQAAERYASIVLLFTKRRRVWASWIWWYLSSNSLLQYCNCLMLSWNSFGNSGSSRTWEGRETAPL